ncbi:MAG: ABC transporter permease [Fimbriimonas sp.]|nr:ABC transporter permease [Fimbriimonas sp.]
MEQAIFFQALRENLRLRRFLPWIVLGVLLVFGFGHLWSTFQPDASLEQRYGTVSSILVFHILALTSAILTSTILSQEIEQKTIVYLVTRPVPRWKLLLFRYLACGLVVSFLGGFNAVCASVGVYGSLGAGASLAKDIAAIVVGAFAYGAFFMFLGLLFNRAMIMCLLFAFGWETMVPNMPGQMCYLSINSYLQAIAQHPSQGGNKGLGLLTSTAGDNTLTSSVGYMAMIGFAVALVALSAWWFSTFEYLPREDAE